MSTAPKLLNVGPKSAAWLRQIGIRSREQLVDAGALGAFVRIKRAGFRPGLNLLYALEGAILDCHWREVPEARRSELLAAAEAAGATAPPPRGKPLPPAEPVRTIWADDDPRAFAGRDDDPVRDDPRSGEHDEHHSDEFADRDDRAPVDRDDT